MSSQKHIFPGKKLESSSSGSHNQLEMCGKSLENAYTNLKVLLVRNTLSHRCIGLASDTNLTHLPSVPSVCTLTARKILWCTRSKWAWLNLKEVSQLWARAAGFLGTNAFWKVSNFPASFSHFVYFFSLVNTAWLGLAFSKLCCFFCYLYVQHCEKSWATVHFFIFF